MTTRSLYITTQIVRTFSVHYTQQKAMEGETTPVLDVCDDEGTFTTRRPSSASKSTDLSPDVDREAAAAVGSIELRRLSANRLFIVVGLISV